MPTLAVQLLFLLCVTLPLAAAGLLAFYRLRQHASLSERLLAILLAVPLVMLAEVFLLTRIPIARPLDWLPWLHGVVALVLAAWCVRDRSLFLEAWRELFNRVTEIRRSQTGTQRLVVSLGIFAFFGAAVWGLWTVPFDQDAAGYHLPQALQPWQDGQLGTVYTEFSYADSYPRASALLWFWTLSISGTDAAFDLVAAWFGAMTCIASYVMARRAGATAGLAACCPLLLPTMPMFGLLATIKQIDLQTTGCVAAALALALPRRREHQTPESASASWPTFDATLAAAMLVLAMWMKFLPIAMIGVVGVLRIVVTLLHASTLRATLRSLTALVFWGVAVALISSPPYVQTWLQYGTPVYPYKLEILGHTFFDGPLTRERISADSGMGWGTRFRIFWVDWTFPLGPQEPSGFGPAWPVLLLPVTAVLALAATVAGAQRLAGLKQRLAPASTPLPEWTCLGALSGLCLVAAATLPHHHWSRYSLWLAPVAVASLAAVLSILMAGPTPTSHSRRPLLAGILLAAAGLQVWAGVLFWQHNVRRIAPLLANSTSEVLTGDRMWPLLHDSYRQDARGPAPATRRWIFRQMPQEGTRGRAGLLINTVAELQGLFHVPPFRFAVEYHTPARRQLWEDQTRTLDAGAEYASTWLELIRARAAGRPLMVVCYSGSTEDLTLAAPGSGFRLGFEQPISDGQYPVRVYILGEPKTDDPRQPMISHAL